MSSINERDLLRLAALASADPRILIEEYKSDYLNDSDELSYDLADNIVQNTPKTSRYNRLYPAPDLSTLASSMVLPGKVVNILHRDGSLEISPKAFADDVLACLQQIRPCFGGCYPPRIDNVTLAILAMDRRAVARHGYSSDEYEPFVPTTLLYSVADSFRSGLGGEKPSVVFADVAQPEKGVGRMFLPVGDILRSDRVVATVSEDGTLRFKSTNRADALAVVGGILKRRTDEHIDDALAMIALEIAELEKE